MNNTNRLYRKSSERTPQNNKIRLYFFASPEDAGESLLLEMKEDLKSIERLATALKIEQKLYVDMTARGSKFYSKLTEKITRPLFINLIY